MPRYRVRTATIEEQGYAAGFYGKTPVAQIKAYQERGFSVEELEKYAAAWHLPVEELLKHMEPVAE